jgi:hypothetical protein
MRGILLSPWSGVAAFLACIAAAFALPSGRISDSTWIVIVAIYAMLLYAVVVWARAGVHAFRNRRSR